MKMKNIAFSLFLVLIAATSVLAAAGGGHAEESPWTTSMLVWRVINTIALIALLVYFLKKPLVTYFIERKAQIQKDLEDAKEQRIKAEELIQEYKTKIAGMENELDLMRAELKKVADAESTRVVANADRMGADMIEAARLAAEQEVRKAKAALKAEAVQLAVKLAESLVREKINENDRKRLVEEYFVKVGGMK